MKEKRAGKKPDNTKKKKDDGKFDVYIPGSYTPPAIPSETPGKENETEEKYSFRKDFRKNRSTWILAFLTFGIVGVSMWQGWVNKNASDEDLRAYVGVSRVDTLYYKKSSDEMAKIFITNSGKTPAKKITIDCIFECWTRNTLADIGDLFDTLKNPHSFRDEYSLSPGESCILPIRPNVIHDSTAHKDTLAYWRDPLDDAHNSRHVYGRITYYDNRDVKHFTVFAFQWEFRTMLYRRVGGMNYFDNDQPDPKGKSYIMTK